MIRRPHALLRLAASLALAALLVACDRSGEHQRAELPKIRAAVTALDGHAADAASGERDPIAGIRDEVARVDAALDALRLAGALPASPDLEARWRPALEASSRLLAAEPRIRGFHDLHESFASDIGGARANLGAMAKVLRETPEGAAGVAVADRIDATLEDMAAALVEVASGADTRVSALDRFTRRSGTIAGELVTLRDSVAGTALESTYDHDVRALGTVLARVVLVQQAAVSLLEAQEEAAMLRAALDAFRKDVDAALAAAG